jgi:hypothetical protein
MTQRYTRTLSRASERGRKVENIFQYQPNSLKTKQIKKPGTHAGIFLNLEEMWGKKDLNLQKPSFSAALFGLRIQSRCVCHFRHSPSIMVR